MAIESLRQHQSKGIKKVTKEDVLKKFLDSKMKSPTNHERRCSRTSSGRSMRSKNILHGVHIPPKILSHSLRKKQNAQFYYTTISSSSSPTSRGQQRIRINHRGKQESEIKAPASPELSSSSSTTTSSMSCVEAAALCPNNLNCGSCTDTSYRVEIHRQSIKA